MNNLVVSSDRASASIELDAGRLASLVVDGMELLVTEAEKPTRWGSFPMVPWCGRLDHAVLDFDGERHEFPPTSGVHANHGTAMHQRWTTVSSEKAAVEIGVDLAEPWPFGGSVTQRFEITDDDVVVHMAVTAGERAMPAQMGWHPWYRRELDRGEPLALEFAAESIYVTNDEQIPDGSLAPVPAGPWDETFIGVTKTPILRWGDALTLALSSNFEHWVVFTQPEHAVAIEPQSGAPNDLNRAPEILEPGQTLDGWMRLAWS